MDKENIAKALVEVLNGYVRASEWIQTDKFNSSAFFGSLERAAIALGMEGDVRKAFLSSRFEIGGGWWIVKGDKGLWTAQKTAHNN